MKAYRTGYPASNTDALTPRLLRQVYGVSQPSVVAGAFGLLDELHH